MTNTPEAEYSPTVTPDRRHISVIRVEADGTQRLWRFAIGGKTNGREQEKEPELVLRDIKPVGYHAWASDEHPRAVRAGSRVSLQRFRWRIRGRVRLKLSRPELAGRFSASRAEASASCSRAASTEGQPPILTISELDPRTGQTRPLVRAPAGATEADTAWTPDGLLLVPFQGQLFGWRRGEAEMSPVADLAPLGVRTVTRLAISPKGDRIALVAQKP